MMNAKNLVKACNMVGVVAILLLAYWVFAFILIQVFGLKVFREHISETFSLSVLGIIVLMAAVLMLNIMFNLTRIAERGQEMPPSRSYRKWWLAAIAMFPLLAAILWGGDYLTRQKKQQILIQAAQQFMNEYPQKKVALADYQFSLAYLQRTSQYLNVLGKQDPQFDHISVIVADQIEGIPVYLSFSGKDSISHHAQLLPEQSTADVLVYQEPQGEKAISQVKKTDYVFAANAQEREYLQRVFAVNANANTLAEQRFVAENGQYELFYPYYDGKQTIVFRLSDYQRYGKLGSY